MSSEDVNERPYIQYEKLAEGIYSLHYKGKSTKLKYTKEQVMTFLERENEEKLREASHYFFNVSGEYRRLVWHFANILTYDYLVIPSTTVNNQVDQSKFQRNFQKILDYTDNSYIQENARFIALTTIIDGIFYGYERQVDGKVVLQQLPPNYCRSTYKINGVHAIEFNLQFFDQYRDTEQKIDVFSLFPNDFFQLYIDYKNGITKEWVQLNPEFARCHKLVENQIPLLSAIFPELINLSEYKELDKSKDEMELYRLIVQKLPIDKQTGLPLLKLEEGRALHQNAKKMITQEGIDVLTTPLEVNSVNLQEKGQTLRDNIERATNSVYTTVGSSKMLFNSNSDGGSIGLSNSIKVDESTMTPLLDQFKRWYENKFKYIIKNKLYKFEILFPPITEFNRESMFKLYKEAATLGYPKLMILPTLGIKQTTFMNMLNFENDYLKLHENMIPLQTSYTQSGESGRPEIGEDELSNKGLETRSRQANDNRAK